jgi:hypothetical protein
MKHILLLSVLFSITAISFAQNTVTTDTVDNNNIKINKDPRLDVLAKKEAEINDANGVLYGGRAARGYRLMLLNTNNRELAMKVRSELLQNFPEQKVYMSFQPPYIKLKFGDFLDKDDAEKYKAEITDAKIITGNIYVVPELVEVKPDKSKDNTAEPTN